MYVYFSFKLFNIVVKGEYMARHKVEICGVNTADIKVLTNEEMTSLFQQLRSGDL